VTSADLLAENARLSAELRELKDQQVEEWVRLIRFGAVVPLAIEESLSWKLTRPVRLAQTALRVLRRDGAHTFIATARARLGRRR
jgi:hypothetical protein